MLKLRANAKNLHRNLLKKASIVGVSALILLGAGAGLASSHVNVHADDNSWLYESTEREDEDPNSRVNRMFDTIAKKDAQISHDGEEALHRGVPQSKLEAYFAAHNIDGWDSPVNVEHTNDVPDTPRENMETPQEVRNHELMAKLTVGQRVSRKLLKKANQQLAAFKRAKSHHHSKKAALAKSANVNLNRQMRKLQWQIKRVSSRKYRTHRTKRNAKRYIAKLTKQYKSIKTQLNEMNRHNYNRKNLNKRSHHRSYRRY